MGLPCREHPMPWELSLLDLSCLFLATEARLLAMLGAHLMGWLSLALGLETTPSTCPHPGAHSAVPFTKDQLAGPTVQHPFPLGLPRKTSTDADTGTGFPTFALEPNSWFQNEGKHKITSRNLFPRKKSNPGERLPVSSKNPYRAQVCRIRRR